ncbi:MAG: PepSY domain-containing protein [Candidatus Bathyarchaeota archaeon]|nr:PepSY domain-containing protein [Candidatus Bathyarchaeota archaeon]
MKAWKKALPILAIALVLIPGVFLAVHAQTPTVTPTTANPNSSLNEQYPNYAGSIKAPENATDQKLTTLATISADQAKAATLKDPTVAGGTVTSVSLDNENGNLVYSVEIAKGSTSYDVKVDAGNGAVLFIDQGIENEVGTVENLED